VTSVALTYTANSYKFTTGSHVSALLLYAQQLQRQALADNHRQILRLQGDTLWCYQQAAQLAELLHQPYFWCGSAPEGIAPHSYKQLLGRETSLLIINALDDFDANAFAAAEGTLRGGGLLLLLTAKNITGDNRFYHYIDKQLSACRIAKICQDQPVSVILKNIETPQTPPALNLSEQKQAVAAIIKTVSGHRRRPLVLTANRGRGKSAALGIAAAQLLQSGLQTILVCAPNKLATSTLFKHASLLVTGNSEHQFSVTVNKQKIAFIAPDALLAEQPQCDLLFIDEAAALPVPMLETAAKHYSRLVFASTLHGYEGSGRGFALRFQKRLNEIAPQWRQLHLEQPIRWADNDPLESFTLNNLCLTESPYASPSYEANMPVKFTQITVQELLDSHTLLQEIFSLLVLAHYQTKPSDLQMLLNDDSLHIFVLRQDKQLLAVALLNQEGGFEEEISERIWLGKRRLQGNLVAQSLTFHSASKDAATQHYARVQRIAIHPSVQNKGLGKLFINHLAKWAEQKKYDHLCASFGATAQLLSFWQQLAFTTLRIGLSRDKSSGTHSLIVNRPLSEEGKALHNRLQQQFQKQFATQLSRQLKEMDSELVAKLLLELPEKTITAALIDSYCQGNLPYEFAEPLLIELLLYTSLQSLNKAQQSLAIEKILQNHSWAEICNRQQYNGKKQAQSALKNTIKQLLEEDNHALR
jgi:tRNA(Met) cytidine acetyltransferase